PTERSAWLARPGPAGATRSTAARAWRVLGTSGRFAPPPNAHPRTTRPRWPPPPSSAIVQFGDPLLLSAMGAAIEHPALLQPVADDAAPAVLAPGCDRLDGAFEAVEHVGLTVEDQLEGLVVVVAAELAGGHGSSSV